MYGKNAIAGMLEFDRPLGLPHRLVDAEPVDARHRGDGNAPLLAFDEEERPDEVVRRQHMLLRRAAAPIRPCGCGAAGGRGRGGRMRGRCGTACSWGEVPRSGSLIHLLARGGRGGFLCFAASTRAAPIPLTKDRWRRHWRLLSQSAGLDSCSDVRSNRGPYQPRAHRDDKDAAPGKRFRSPEAHRPCRLRGELD